MLIDNKKSTLYKGIVLMILSSLCGSTGQLFWKLGADHSFLFIILGFLCYVSGVFVMISALKHGELSVLYPVMSFSYIMALFYGKLILGETISLIKVTGIITLIAGLIILNLKEKEKKNDCP
ncbi:MAG: EamA family transporter [Clostridia bacterium]|nr:EamA family transporter [Clostridia bacterium]